MVISARNCVDSVLFHVMFGIPKRILNFAVFSGLVGDVYVIFRP